MQKLQKEEKKEILKSLQKSGNISAVVQKMKQQASVFINPSGNFIYIFKIKIIQHVINSLYSALQVSWHQKCNDKWSKKWVAAAHFPKNDQCPSQFSWSYM